MGDANVTRDRFATSGDPSGILYKIFQQGTYLADSDVNEVGQVTLHRAARMLYRLTGGIPVRFGSGWALTGGTGNHVYVSAGEAAIPYTTEKSLILNRASAATLTGATTPTGTRTDCIYLDITFTISDSDDDTTLVNPTIGKETAVDAKVSYSFVWREGYATPPTAPSGHYYVLIATIARTASSTISDASITNLVISWSPIQQSTPRASVGMTYLVHLAGYLAYSTSGADSKLYFPNMTIYTRKPDGSGTTTHTISAGNVTITSAPTMVGVIVSTLSANTTGETMSALAFNSLHAANDFFIPIAYVLGSPGGDYAPIALAPGVSGMVHSGLILASAYSSDANGPRGAIYFDTDDQKIKVWDTMSWKSTAALT